MKESDIQENEQTTENTPSTDITVQDLQNLKDIIDLASSRGAFRPKEMVPVGHVYTKLEDFLYSVANQQKKGS